MNSLYRIVDDALRFSGVGNYLSKNLIIRRIRNIIQQATTDDIKRDKILVLVHDSVSDAGVSLLDFVGGCFQKIQGKELIYSSVHSLYSQSGRTIIVLIVK